MTTSSTSAVWLLDSVTTRNSVDQTCHNNARAVVADPAGNIHIVWRGRAPDTFAIWYSSWDHARRQWNSDTIIYHGTRSAGEPAIACDSGGNIYVVWPANGLLWLKRRSFITREWELIDSLSGDLSDIAVALTIDQFQHHHCCWNRKTPTGNALLLYTYRSDTGWSHGETVAFITNYEPVRPAVACSPSGTVMVTWKQPPNPYIVAARLRLATGWAEIETVYSYRTSSQPAVCADADSFHVIWVSGSQSAQSVLYRARGEGGWGDTCRLNQWSRGKSEPSIICDDSGNLHCAWIDGEPVNGTKQICYRKRTAAGDWDTVQVLKPANASIDRERLSISARQGTVQIAWTDILGASVSQVRLLRYEQLSDVAILRITHPGDTIDSAAVVTPMAVIKNTGDLAAESILVFFHLADSSRSSFIDQLGVNESTVVVFASLPVHTRGNATAVCSTLFRNDAIRNNNSVRKNIFVRVQDIVLESIIAPRNRIYELTVQPRIRIWNAGNVDASFTACCSIISLARQQPVYTSMINLRLGRGVRRDTAFPVWETDTGNYYARFRLNLNGDLHPENDTASRCFRVVNQDAGVSAIIWPTGIVDSGTAGPPQILIKNYGDDTATVKAKIIIGNTYQDSVFIAIASGDSVITRFNIWQARARNHQTVFCSLSCPGDRNPTNDTMSTSLFVQVLDAGVVAIPKPESINSRREIVPQIQVRNFGNRPSNLPVYLSIYDSAGSRIYADSLLLAGLEPEQESLLCFSLWQATGGSYRASARTSLVADMQPANDTLTKLFRVTRRDAAVLRIAAPAETILAEAVTPVIVVHNPGEETAEFNSSLYIFASLPDTTPVYAESLPVRLASGDSARLDFNQWQAEPGSYLVLARVRLEGDENPANDSTGLICFVDSISARHWRELLSIPPGPHNKPVRAGGSLVATGSRLFAFKGGGSNEFWEYEPSSRSWMARASLPDGERGRKIRNGSALCWDGGSRIYALKGNNTREFWCYYIPDDTWLSLPALPDFTPGVRFGSGLAYVPPQDTGKLYCLKGSNTNEFLVYWVKQREWHARRPVPKGPSDKPVKSGSAMTGLGKRVFVLKGATNEFYEYITERDSWRTCSALPLTSAGTLKKCRSGTALTSDNRRYIYAFKGGKTTEFWRYDAVSDSWERLQDIPLGIRWRRIGAGGALAFLNGRIYAFKGGGTREFWCYETTAAICPRRSPFPVSAEQLTRCDSPTLALNSGKKPVLDQPLIYDATGRIVRNRHLHCGVYFIIHSDQGGKPVTHKIIKIR